MPLSNTVNDLFANEILRRVLFKARFLLAFVLLIPLAMFMEPRWLWPGFAISMTGQAIQTWSFASLVKNRELTMRGPYLLSRNPMYVGRFFLLLGFFVLLGNVYAVIAFVVLYYLYMVNRVKREERRLARVFGDRFREYCARVRRFVPSLFALGNRDVWFFDWGRFRENNAHWNLLSTLLAFAAILGIRELLARFG